MDNTPHTHKIVISTGQGFTSTLINYGDQVKRVTHLLPFFQSRLRYEAKKIVRKHDKGSIKNKGVHTQALQKEMNDLLLDYTARYDKEIQGAWGSDPKSLALLQAEIEAYTEKEHRERANRMQPLYTKKKEYLV